MRRSIFRSREQELEGNFNQNEIPLRDEDRPRQRERMIEDPFLGTTVIEELPRGFRGNVHRLIRILIDNVNYCLRDLLYSYIDGRKLLQVNGNIINLDELINVISTELNDHEITVHGNRLNIHIHIPREVVRRGWYLIDNTLHSYTTAIQLLRADHDGIYLVRGETVIGSILRARLSNNTVFRLFAHIQPNPNETESS